MNINAINSKASLLAMTSKADLYGERPKPTADVAVKAEVNPKDIISVSAAAVPQKDDAVSAAVDYAKKLASARDHYRKHPVKSSAEADVAVPVVEAGNPPICFMPIRPITKPIASIGASGLATAAADLAPMAASDNAPTLHPTGGIKPIRQDVRHQEWADKMKFWANSRAETDRQQMELKIKLSSQWTTKHPFATSNG